MHCNVFSFLLIWTSYLLCVPLTASFFFSQPPSARPSDKSGKDGASSGSEGPLSPSSSAEEGAVNGDINRTSSMVLNSTDHPVVGWRRRSVEAISSQDSTPNGSSVNLMESMRSQRLPFHSKKKSRSVLASRVGPHSTSPPACPLHLLCS